MAALTNGDVDIAALATNVASTLYHKTGGDIQIAALNTRGMLYILERGGETVTSLEDLEGETIYAFGQGANPEYILNYLLEENDMDPAKDVEVIWKSADEVAALMLSGEAKYCMLPVPAATALMVKSEASGKADMKIYEALDLTELWDTTDAAGTLTMSSIVVRREFAEANPEVVMDFLEEHEASVDFVVENPKEAAPMAVEFGLVPSAAIAERAIPQINLISITGKDMRHNIQGYYEVLFDANPKSIGGSIPDDAFYFIAD